jgi:hypothetical protein
LCFVHQFPRRFAIRRASPSFLFSQRCHIARASSRSLFRDDAATQPPAVYLNAIKTPEPRPFATFMSFASAGFRWSSLPDETRDTTLFHDFPFDTSVLFTPRVTETVLSHTFTRVIRRDGRIQATGRSRRSNFFRSLFVEP